MAGPTRFSALVSRLCAALLAGLMLAGVGGLARAQTPAPTNSLDYEVNAKTGLLTVKLNAFNGDTGVYYTAVYRARSANAGMFGSDWGSSLEYRLVPMLDGTVAQVSQGNGVVSRYGAAPDWAFASMIDSLANAELGVGGGSATERATLKSLLATSLDYRVAVTETYGVQGSVPDETELKLDYYIAHPDQCCQTLRRISDFWRVEWGEGNYEQYDEMGRLSSIKDRLHHLFLGYYSDGPLNSACYVDAAYKCTKVLQFYYPANAVVVDSEAGERVTYTRDGKGRLIAVEHSTGRAYRFRYNDRGNLVAIQLPDENVLVFTYDSAGRVLTVASQTGVFARYSY